VETVERFLDRAPTSSRLYLLPADVKGQACFRVCFGSYPSADAAAAAASSIPAELKSGVGAPSPKKIADLAL
jgi:septal ring-binding cell division protein DamX